MQAVPRGSQDTKGSLHTGDDAGAAPVAAIVVPLTAASALGGDAGSDVVDASDNGVAPANTDDYVVSSWTRGFTIHSVYREVS